MLLITDRVERSRSLARALSAWGPCEVMALADAETAAPGPRRLIVTDVSLSDRGSIEVLRQALARHRSAGAPYLCLLREQSARAIIQANAIGATDMLPADSPTAMILQAVGQVLNADAKHIAAGTAAPLIHSHFIAATAALADMLEAAAEGRGLSKGAIESSVDSMNQAADKADLGTWLEMVWSHDDLTYQHCLLVAGLAAAFSRHLNFAAEDRRLLTCAAVLHDIGKARIPHAILNKASSLDDAELVIMRTHPQIGAEMLLRQGGFAKEIVAAVRSHHEYLDGSGYPDGLRGKQISDIVRMITICDIYAALIERRSYKAPMRPEAAYDLLVAMGGKLDVDLVRVFKTVVLSEAAGSSIERVQASRSSA